MPRVVMLLDACISCRPLSKLNSCWYAADREVRLVAFNPNDPPGWTVVGLLTAPAENKLPPPALTIMGNCEGALIEARMSAARPPHPAVAKSCGEAVCHWFCWLECENRESGNLTDWPRY